MHKSETLPLLFIRPRVRVPQSLVTASDLVQNQLASLINRQKMTYSNIAAGIYGSYNSDGAR